MIDNKEQDSDPWSWVHDFEEKIDGYLKEEEEEEEFVKFWV